MAADIGIVDIGSTTSGPGLGGVGATGSRPQRPAPRRHSGAAGDGGAAGHGRATGVAVGAPSSSTGGCRACHAAGDAVPAARELEPSPPRSSAPGRAAGAHTLLEAARLANGLRGVERCLRASGAEPTTGRPPPPGPRGRRAGPIVRALPVSRRATIVGTSPYSLGDLIPRAPPPWALESPLHLSVAISKMARRASPRRRTAEPARERPFLDRLPHPEAFTSIRAPDHPRLGCVPYVRAWRRAHPPSSTVCLRT